MKSQYTCADTWSQNRSTDGTFYGNLTTEENDAVSKHEADLETLADERVLKFVVGDLNLESDWDAFILDMETQGSISALRHTRLPTTVIWKISLS